VTIAKALVGALIAFVGALVTATVTGGIGLHEWLYAVLAGLVALAGVYGTARSRSPTGATSPN
jgi:Na+/glutamate symporter